jgi:SAM-dependent methyltransferase
VDGTVEFYGRVNALLSPGMRVLDFGAGRGKDALDDQVPYRRGLRVLRGKVKCVVGVDIDLAVASNPSIDSAVLIDEARGLPFARESFDLIVSDHTFEHVRDPVHVAAELDRILAPRGWLCARTPNRWGYIALGARVVPNRTHVSVLRRVQPSRLEHDVFPTCYRLNTLSEVARYFPPDRYADHSYYYDPEPAYFGRSIVAMRAARGAFRLLPTRLSAILMIFKQKRS